MTGGRQMWTGLAMATTSLLLSALYLGIPGFGGPAVLPGLGAATVIATAMLVSWCLARPVPALQGNELARPMGRAAGTLPSVAIRSFDPDAPGAARPRAPGACCAAPPA